MRVLLFIALAACTTRRPLDVVSFRVSGELKLGRPPVPPDIAISDDQLGGDLHIVLYADAGLGYCLRPLEHVHWLASKVVADMSSAALQGTTVAYSIEVLEAPDQPYPFDVYPVAIWQNTSSLQLACEYDAPADTPRVNAIGWYGVSAADLATRSPVPCCGFAPAALRVESRGVDLGGVDFELVPQANALSPCAPAGTPAAACALRHPPGLTVGDSQCARALGPEAAPVFGDAPCASTRMGYTLRGTLRFADAALTAGLGFSDDQFGGDVHLSLFSHDGPNYCSEGRAALSALFPLVLRGPTITSLRQGVPFEIEVDVDPSTAFPLTIYPAASWQHTTVAGVRCDTDAEGQKRFNAGALHGVDPLTATPTSPCCGFVPQPLQIPHSGAIVSGVELSLLPQGVASDPCPPAGTPPPICPPAR